MRAGFNAAMRRLPRAVVWAAGAVPFIVLVVDMVWGRLGVDPLRALEHRTGRVAIYFLVATLCVTPLLRLGGFNLMRFRRVLGMLTFVYAALHVLIWVVLDRGLVWDQIGAELLHRPFVTIGALSLVILVILAVTASDRAIRWLGSGNWQLIHRGVYIAALLGAWHWLLSEKVPGGRAQVILGVIVILLGWRAWFMFGKWRRRRHKYS